MENVNFREKAEHSMRLAGLVMLIAIVSIVCAFFVGEGGIAKYFRSEDAPETVIEDPADYYGTYYSAYKEEYRTLVLNEDGTCVYLISNGLQGSGSEAVCQYVYTSASYLKKHYNITQSSYLENDANAILIKMSDDTALILWIASDDPYSLVIDTSGVVFTTSAYDFGEEMGDPKDYYNRYEYSDGNYVIFSQDGTAVLTLNNETDYYCYSFVNRAWLERYTQYDYEKAIIVYKGGETTFRIFKYEDGGEIALRNGTETYPFSKE